MKYNLTWTPNPESTSQEVFRSNTQFTRNNPPSVPFSVLSGSDNTLEDNAILPWKKYWYSVASVRERFGFKETSLANPIAVGYEDEIVPRISARPSWYSRPYSGVDFLQDGTTFTRSTPATRINSDGLLETVSVDVIRQSYDPITKGLVGWRVEGLRTNQVIQARFPSHADWTKVRSSVTPNAIADIFGGNTGEKIIEDTTTSSSKYVYSKGFTVNVGEQWCFWGIFKKAERDYVWIDFSDITFGSESICFFDLNTGAVSSQRSGIDNAGVIGLGSGRYLCWVVDTATTTGAANFVCGLSATNGVTAYTGDGTSGVYFLGGQAEKGSYPTSFIDTSATAVTRATDQHTVDATEIGIPLDGSPFSLLWEGFTAPGIETTQYSMVVDDGGITNSVHIGRVFDGRVFLFVSSGGVEQLTLVGPQIEPAQHVRFAASIEDNNTSFVIAVKGADLGSGIGRAILVGTDTNCTVPTGLTTVVDQNRSDMTLPGNGITARRMFYDSALSVSDLISLCNF